MKVLIDTSIWSLALRRNASSEAHKFSKDKIEALKNLIEISRVEIIGIIRQEILSGIANSLQFKKIRDYLSSFPDLDLSTHCYELAAEYYNLARKKGIQGSHNDFLICASASINNLLIFTADNDFKHYAKLMPIKLYSYT